MTNPYEILGIAPEATKEEITKAFKELAKLHHPDKHGGEANEMFDEIKAAYDLLMDETKRKLFDDYGHNPNDEQSKLRMEAIGEIMAHFGQILNRYAVEQYEQIDFLQIIRSNIDDGLRTTDENINQIRRNEHRNKHVLKIIKKRMKRKKGVGGKNLFIDVLEKNLSVVPQQILRAEHEKKILNEMLNVLDSYEFDNERFLTLSGPSRIGTSALAAAIWGR